MMFLNDYQENAWRFASPQASPAERIFGLLEEAGEVAGLYKRVFRGDYEDVPKDKLLKELGDVLWYLSGVAKDNGLSLDEVAKTNLAKLQDRMNRGVLKGQGDER